MKAHFLVALLGPVLLFGCGHASEQEVGGSVTPSKSIAPGSVTGVYSNVTVNEADESFGTELWVRDDSTYVLRETKPVGDGFPVGTIGQWQLRDGKLITKGPTVAITWHGAGTGLESAGSDGEGAEKAERVTLARMQGLPLYEIPVMRLHGRYRFANGSHSFEPDGAGRELPFGVGEMADEMESVFNGRSDQRVDFVCVEVECLLTRGTAQEGATTVEYAILFQMNSTLPPSECR